MSIIIDIERYDAENEDEKEEQSSNTCKLFFFILVVLAAAIGPTAGIYFIIFPIVLLKSKDATRCGKDWMPGSLQPKVQLGNFLI